MRGPDISSGLITSHILRVFLTVTPGEPSVQSVQAGPLQYFRSEWTESIT